MGQQNKATQLQLIVGRQPPHPKPELDTWLRQAPTAMFDALLDQSDPRGQSRIDAAARSARRLCGRWLALARLRLGLPSAVLAEVANVDEKMLHMLEAGLVDEGLLPESARGQIVALLVGAVSDPALASQILAIAVGQALPSEDVLRKVEVELAELDSGGLEEDADSYELFRRAVVAQDAEAWAEIHGRYRPLLISWARRRSATAQLDEDPASLADQALARVWRALTPERFAQFPNMAALMGYLRACVYSTVVDEMRAQVRADRDRMQFDQQTPLQPSLEQVVLDKLDYMVLWRAIFAIATSPAEGIVLLDSFIYCQSPREIYALHPDLFPDVGAVYKAKRNLLDRMKRSPELRERIGWNDGQV